MKPSKFNNRFKPGDMVRYLDDDEKRVIIVSLIKKIVTRNIRIALIKVIIFNDYTLFRKGVVTMESLLKYKYKVFILNQF
jgi:hypothetical protein